MAFADDWGKYASAYAKLQPGGMNDLVSTPNFDRVAGEGVLFTNVMVWDGTSEALRKADVLVTGNTIAEVSDEPLAVIQSTDMTVIDGGGRTLMPGLIDAHSHLGVYPSPGVRAHSDGNEATKPATPNVWAEHSVWPQDPGFSRALAGGITTLQTPPGSANLFGGRGVTLKNVYSTSYQGIDIDAGVEVGHLTFDRAAFYREDLLEVAKFTELVDQFVEFVLVLEQGE